MNLGQIKKQPHEIKRLIINIFPVVYTLDTKRAYYRRTKKTASDTYLQIRMSLTQLTTKSISCIGKNLSGLLITWWSDVRWLCAKFSWWRDNKLWKIWSLTLSQQIQNLVMKFKKFEIIPYFWKPCAHCVTIQIVNSDSTFYIAASLELTLFQVEWKWRYPVVTVVTCSAAVLMCRGLQKESSRPLSCCSPAIMSAVSTWLEPGPLSQVRLRRDKGPGGRPVSQTALSLVETQKLWHWQIFVNFSLEE